MLAPTRLPPHYFFHTDLSTPSGRTSSPTRERRMASELPNPSSDGFAEPVIPTSGFEQAFDALVERHYPRLCTFALRLLGSPDAAEDAVQEVLSKIWTRRTIENVRDPVPYIY